MQSFIGGLPTGDSVAVAGKVELLAMHQSRAGKILAYLELTKPRITFLVVLTAAAGFGLGSGSGVDYLQLFNMAVGVCLLSAGTSALNQYIERDIDRLMKRTESRPLPSARLSAGQALIFGWLMSALGSGYLWLAFGSLTALLGLATLAGYLFVYTPLKTRTTLSTFLGAFPGAMPPVIGWVAARGEVTVEALILFAILFLWQFPHFLAIAWMYRDDYARAGIKMLPVVEPDGRVTRQQIITYTTMLVPVSLLPVMADLSGRVYFAGALVLGLLLLYCSVNVAMRRSKWQARRLLFATVLYLPLLFALMVINK